MVMKCHVELQPAKAHSMGCGSSTAVLSVVLGPASISPAWELVRNANAQPSPQPKDPESETPGGWGPAGGVLSALR